MKKILFGLMAILSFFLMSCSNEEIEIKYEDKYVEPEPPKELYDLTLNVSTRGMYDTFKAADEIMEKYVRDKDFCVGVWTYVYDSKGTCVDSVFTSDYSFNLQSQKLKEIEKGKYTVVTIESLADPDDNFSLIGLSITGGKSIETLAIKQIWPSLSIPSIAGVSVNSIDLVENKAINVNPETLGAKVEFYCYNFANSNFVNLAFATEDCLDSYLINPNIDEKSRYQMDITASTNFCVRAELTPAEAETQYSRCYILEPDIHYYCARQEADQAGTVHWKIAGGAEGTATLKRGGTYYLGFNYDKGKQSIYLTDDEETFAEWVESINTPTPTPPSTDPYFEYPCTRWGQSKAIVKAALAKEDYTVMKEGAFDDGSPYVKYEPKFKEQHSIYRFYSTGGLDCMWYQMDYETQKFADIADFVKETFSCTYKTQGTFNDGTAVIRFFSEDNTTVIDVRMNEKDKDLYVFCFSKDDLSETRNRVASVDGGYMQEGRKKTELPELKAAKEIKVFKSAERYNAVGKHRISNVANYKFPFSQK